MRILSQIVVCMIFLLRSAHSEPLTIAVPKETDSLKPSTLPGYVVAQQQCAICHSVDYIKFQPPHLTLAQWTSEVTKMQHAYGAPIKDQDVALVGGYLAVTYGSAKEEELAPRLRDATGILHAADTSGGVVDVQGLLSRNGCLGCHAVDKRVIGPSYREVASKYRGNAAADSTLQSSIRAGSSGKWGSVSMPAFPQLQPDEIKAIAHFVLSQQP